LSGSGPFTAFLSSHHKNRGQQGLSLLRIDGHL
jgi:hypothetical protein